MSKASRAAKRNMSSDMKRRATMVEVSNLKLQLKKSQGLSNQNIGALVKKVKEFDYMDNSTDVAVHKFHIDVDTSKGDSFTTPLKEYLGGIYGNVIISQKSEILTPSSGSEWELQDWSHRVEFVLSKKLPDDQNTKMSVDISLHAIQDHWQCEELRPLMKIGVNDFPEDNGTYVEYFKGPSNDEIEENNGSTTFRFSVRAAMMSNC